MKTNTKLLTLLGLVLSGAAFASANRILDAQQITNGSATLIVPSVSDTLAGVTTVQTLTGKTISGASNTITNIPASALSGITLGVANGGTGLTSVTSNALLIGNGSGALQQVTAGVQYGVLQSTGPASAPTFGALNLAQAAATTGQLPVSAGGTGLGTLTSGSVIVGAGTSSPTFVAPGTSGNVLTSNGSTWSSSAPAAVAPTITGSSGSPTSVTAVGGVAFSGSAYTNVSYIQGSGGPVTVTANPQIAAGTADGQALVLVGRSATNTVTLADGTGLSLNGAWVGGLDSVLILRWDGSVWREDARR